jgi:hypothetical protein
VILSQARRNRRSSGPSSDSPSSPCFSLGSCSSSRPIGGPRSSTGPGYPRSRAQSLPEELELPESEPPLDPESGLEAVVSVFDDSSFEPESEDEAPLPIRP